MRPTGSPWKIAANCDCLYSGKPSWRRLLTLIARGVVVVSVKTSSGCTRFADARNLDAGRTSRKIRARPLAAGTNSPGGRHPEPRCDGKRHWMRRLLATMRRHRATRIKIVQLSNGFRPDLVQRSDNSRPQNELTALEVRRAVWNDACYVRPLHWQGEWRPAWIVRGRGLALDWTRTVRGLAVAGTLPGHCSGHPPDSHWHFIFLFNFRGF
jgi:hypothetical protein